MTERSSPVGPPPPEPRKQLHPAQLNPQNVGDPIAVDRDALRGPRRVSPFGPVFLAWAVIRQVGFLNIGIFTAVVGSRNFQLVGLAASVGLMLIGVARWWRFTYELEASDEGDQLVTLSGVFSRNRTSVPLDRIQAVSTRQNLLHRVVNLVEVNVQTAGSIGAEVQLTAVRPAVAERIRRLSTATTTSGEVVATRAVGDADAPPLPPEADPVLRRSLREVLVVAVTRNPLVLLAPIPLAVAFGVEAEEFLARFSDQAADVVDGIGGSVFGVVLAVLVVVVISALVSIAFVVLRLFDLRLFIDGAGIRRLSGLLSRTEVTASRERVQLVAVRMNPLERVLGLRELVLPVAGGAASVQLANAVPTALQLPGTRPVELERVVEVVLGVEHRQEPGHGGSERRGISPLAVRRWTMWGGVLPAVIAAVGLWFLLDWFAVLALVWVPPMWVLARLRQRSWQWSLGPETLRIRNGVIGEVRRDMPVRKAQNVVLDQGIFHRRHGLADVKVRTASRVQMVVPLLPLAEARAVRDELLYRAERDPRPFM